MPYLNMACNKYHVTFTKHRTTLLTAPYIYTSQQLCGWNITEYCDNAGLYETSNSLCGCFNDL